MDTYYGVSDVVIKSKDTFDEIGSTDLCTVIVEFRRHMNAAIRCSRSDKWLSINWEWEW